MYVPSEFRRCRERGLRPGVLQNVFLFATTECRESYKEITGPWVWAVDPDWSSGPDEDGFDGRVSVMCGRLYNKFYEFISDGEITLKDIWKEYHLVNETTTGEPLPGWAITQLPKPKWPDS